MGIIATVVIDIIIIIYNMYIILGKQLTKYLIIINHVS